METTFRRGLKLALDADTRHKNGKGTSVAKSYFVEKHGFIVTAERNQMVEGERVFDLKDLYDEQELEQEALTLVVKHQGVAGLIKELLKIDPRFGGSDGK